MVSRQGRIALQLTQWVGGTIIVLMFIFVIADYLIQRRYFDRYLETSAEQSADGLKTFLSARKLDESTALLDAAGDLASYTESNQGIYIFDLTGKPLFTAAGELAAKPEETTLLAQPAMEGRVEVRHLKLSGQPVVVAATAFETKDEPPIKGFAAFVLNAEEHQQIGLELWGWRSAIVLLMIVGVMLAVRIPVKRFVVAPIDGLFMAAYAASKDDYRKLPVCPVDNEFSELYDMFGRMMGHLSDTRSQEGQPEEDAVPSEEESIKDQPIE